MFTWTLRRGLPLEHARTVAVNTIVVMEIFYLFSVRYLYSASISWTGVLGTSAVLIGVAAVVLAQLAFTYLGPMQDLFETRSLTIVEGIAVVAVGIVLLLVLEGEKAFWRFFFAAK
jgi:magnesium-transporting ATPase (P-type)